MPLGPSRITAYLNFDGRCEEAFRFYELTLGGKISLMMTFGESPMADSAPPDWAKKILHATYQVKDQTLGGSDAFPGQYEKPRGFSVALDIAEPAEADRIFKALGEGGEVQMECQETFWALRFGQVTDRFGIPWIINCGKPN